MRFLCVFSVLVALAYAAPASLKETGDLKIFIETGQPPFELESNEGPDTSYEPESIEESETFTEGPETPYEPESSEGSETSYEPESSEGSETSYEPESSEGPETSYEPESTEGPETSYEPESTEGPETSYEPATGSNKKCDDSGEVHDLGSDWLKMNDAEIMEECSCFLGMMSDETGEPEMECLPRACELDNGDYVLPGETYNDRRCVKGQDPELADASTLYYLAAPKAIDSIRGALDPADGDGDGDADSRRRWKTIPLPFQIRGEMWDVDAYDRQ